MTGCANSSQLENTQSNSTQSNNDLTNYEFIRLSEYNEKNVTKEDSVSGTNEEQQYAFDKKIEELSTIKVVSYNNNDGTAICIIHAPDMYNYIMEKIDTIADQTDTETYELITKKMTEKDVKIRETEVVVNVLELDGSLILDDTSFEFQDAIHGGMNSVLTELIIKSIEELADEGKENEN